MSDAVCRPARVIVGSLLVLACVGHTRPAAAQDAAAAVPRVDVSGAVSVTNKGISTIPSFTLGRPATIVDVAIRRGTVGFEPQFRFGLDGKPWSILFWARYRPITTGRFRLSLGGHPALSFRTIKASTNGVERDVIQARRYVASEIIPTFAITSRVRVGSYYLYSHGIDNDAAPHTHFVAARATVSNLKITERYSLQFMPQLYYLWTDRQTGTYLNAGATLARQGFPLSLSSTVNKPIRSNVTGGQAFLWNVSANYALK